MPDHGLTHAELELSTARTIGAQYSAPKSVVFVVNNDRSFLSHRASWASALHAGGSSILVIAEDTGRSDEIRALGFDFHPVAFGRESIGARDAVVVTTKVATKLLRVRPDLVFLS